MKLKGKISLVTGAGQGLGEAIARHLAAEGASVVVNDINPPTASRVAEAIKREYAVEAIAAPADVTNGSEVAAMVAKATATFGRLDILVSNAGILKSYEISEFPEEDWRCVIEVNLTGYFLCAREVAKVMKRQKSGVIIQINSKSGKKGSFHNSAYSASKFGGIGLTQSLALDLAPYGIRVNAVLPGNLLDSPLWTDSLYEQYSRKWGISKEEVKKKYLEQVPMARGCTYRDVGKLVVFLASDESSYITGQAINVDGGEVMR